MTYSLKSLVKFVGIVTAPESKSQVELLVLYEERKDIVLLSNQLTHMAASHGHKLVVRPVWLYSEFKEFISSVFEQYRKADRMHDSLLYGKK